MFIIRNVHYGKTEFWASSVGWITMASMATVYGTPDLADRAIRCNGLDGATVVAVDAKPEPDATGWPDFIDLEEKAQEIVDATNPAIGFTFKEYELGLSVTIRLRLTGVGMMEITSCLNRHPDERSDDLLRYLAPHAWFTSDQRREGEESGHFAGLAQLSQVTAQILDYWNAALAK